MSSPGYPAAGLALFPQAAARPPSGRAKLWTLPSLYFCSILGTCLTSLELRKLVAQRLGMATRESTDLAVHEQAVEAAGRADAGGRELHRALESKYQETIKRFERAKTPEELAVLWEAAMEAGSTSARCYIEYARLEPESSWRRLRRRCGRCDYDACRRLSAA